MDALVDELLLGRGVERDDLARHRDPRIRDFLPDPSCFQDMDKGASGSPTRSRPARRSPSSATMTSTAPPAPRC